MRFLDPVKMYRLFVVVLAGSGLVLSDCDRQPRLKNIDSTDSIKFKPTVQSIPREDPWSGRTDLIKAPPAASPKPVKLPQVQRTSLSNGLLVRLVGDGSWPVVNIHLVVFGGTDQEPMGKRGLSNFVAQMLTKGTSNRAADDIAEQIDFVGGRLRAWADLDGTHIVCQVLSKDLDTCMDLVPDIVSNPTFPKKEMGVVRDRLITMVKNVRDVDRRLVVEHFENLLWGEQNIRGWPKTVKSVNSIDRNDLVKWHETLFKPNNAVLAVAGDIDRDTIVSSLEKAFGHWKRGQLPSFRTYSEPEIKGVKIRLVDKPDQTQTQIRIGHMGLEHKHPDFLAASLVNYVLGGGAFSSRLMKIVRAKGGKTYGAKSHFDKDAKRGEFWIWTFTRTKQTLSTLKMLLDELERMKTGGPSVDELNDAKSNLAGSYPMNFETSEDVADAVLSAELHGLSERIVRHYPLLLSAVSLDDAKRVAREYLHPKNLVIALVGRAEEIEPQLAKAGFAYEKVGYLEPTTATERMVAREKLSTPMDPQKTFQGRQLLDAALEATGGKQRVKGIRDVYMEGKGSVEAAGQRFDVEVRGWLKLPDKRRLELKMPMGSVISVVSPDGVWAGLGTMVKPASDTEARIERDSLWRAGVTVLSRHLESGVLVQAGDRVRRGGREFDEVEIRKPDNSVRTFLQLDTKTHMLSAMRYEQDGDEVLEEFSDYRDVDGIMMPYHQLRKGKRGQKIEMQLDRIEINKGVSETLFDNPSKETDSHKK